MFTLGTDFSFQFANITYNFIDQIVKLVKDDKRGNKFSFKYSTVREYLDAV